ncbi:phosphonate ABC transporter ATP-binding protein [Scytonema hofmannii PCC 7110]|uniref:Phosphonate ABC transporter ATP-binding protein n=1 Tax=Scytonema hofmannii PCC 7110 TaxID=128403 RepID=A0A139WXN2_9CYAN|nr:phosphonate ABC transporter ATP-binding protein [Scytonema hofmannii]KYC37205.1 phosphonate ABC transporter ATP-binding protein [Scytonema hofmannii PCC 7110]
MCLIQLNQVSKRYENGFQALHATTLTINPGEFTVILGPSGAGKSTLLRLINGLETLSSGEIFIANRQLTKENRRRLRAKVGMVFQHFNLVSRLNVMTNVLTGRLYHRSWWESLLYLFPKKDYELAHWALTRVNLTDKAWNRASKLSGGQQQRVAIARVLAQQPEVILADEPVASLDPVTTEEIMHLLREICKSDGVTVVASLHQVGLAIQFAERIIGINSGQVVFDGTACELFHKQEILETIYRRADGSLDEKFNMEMALAKS